MQIPIQGGSVAAPKILHFHRAPRWWGRCFWSYNCTLSSKGAEGNNHNCSLLNIIIISGAFCICARHCTYIEICNLKLGSWRQYGLEKVRELPTVVQLISGRKWAWTQAFLDTRAPIFPLYTTAPQTLGSSTTRFLSSLHSTLVLVGVGTSLSMSSMLPIHGMGDIKASSWGHRWTPLQLKCLEQCNSRCPRKLVSFPLEI